MSQAIHELAYWKDTIAREGGVEGFMNYRRGGLPYRIDSFPSFKEQKGLGLDMGCGPISVFEFGDYQVKALDPLYDQYKKLLPVEPKNEHFQMDGEATTFADNTFDWVFCYNVIDHTPDPKRMAGEMFRILKPGGKLYLQVNFDDVLTPAHYAIWNMELALDVLKDFAVDWFSHVRAPDDKRDYLFIEAHK